MATSELIGLAEIEDARERLVGVAVATPLDSSRALARIAGGAAYVKCENLQRTGSFKIRGAYNLISRLDAEERAAGVVAASAGNHAQGVALAASLSKIRSTVFMPVAAPLPKIEATRRYGAEVILEGADFGAAFTAATRFSSESGAVFVHAYDDPLIIAGQGTAGLEIVEMLPDVASVIVPVGGGGLISGVAAAVKQRAPSARVIGVEASGAAAVRASLDKGSIVRLDQMTTIADGIAANAPGSLTFAHVSALVDEVVTVTDEAIAEALLFAAERMKLVLEPAGAAGVAALMQGLVTAPPPVAVVLSGGNIDPLLLLRVIRFGLSAAGRYFAFHTRIPDQPGALHRLLGLVADAGANVVGVEHHREGAHVQLDEVDVTLQIETKGSDHIVLVRERLEAGGYRVEPL